MTTGFGGFVSTVVLWRPLFATGLERCVYSRYDNGAHSLEGTVVIVRDEEPIEIDYTINLDRDWKTVNAEVAVAAEEAVVFTFSRDKHNRWLIESETGDDMRIEGERDPIFDLDLGFTSATNMLPIRRLDLGIGDYHDVTALWLKYPEWTIQPLRQTYTRLDDMIYRYESPNFSAEITVDDLGLPIDYASLWERVR